MPEQAATRLFLPVYSHCLSPAPVGSWREDADKSPPGAAHRTEDGLAVGQTVLGDLEGGLVADDEDVGGAVGGCGRSLSFFVVEGGHGGPVAAGTRWPYVS
jgi:hypothetical protein